MIASCGENITKLKKKYLTELNNPIIVFNSTASSFSNFYCFVFQTLVPVAKMASRTGNGVIMSQLKKKSRDTKKNTDKNKSKDNEKKRINSIV